MTVEAELVNSLRKLQTQVAATTQSVDRMGDKLQQAMRRGATETERAGRQVEVVSQKVQRAGMSIAGALGIGSVGAALMTGVNLIERALQASKEAEAARQRELRQSRGIAADTPAARRALALSMPTATADQRTAFARSFAQGLGAQPLPDQLAAAGRLVRATGAFGFDPLQVGEALGSGAAAGIGPDQYANLLGGLLSTNQLGQAGGLTRGRLRSLARTGDLGSFIGTQRLAPDDIIDLAGLGGRSILGEESAEAREVRFGNIDLRRSSQRGGLRIDVAAREDARRSAIEKAVGPEFASRVVVVGWESPPPIAQPIAPEAP